MKFWKKTTAWALVLALALSLGLTWGAGATGADESISGEVTIWTGTWNEELLPELLKGFNEQYPNITVQAEYLPWDGMEDKYLAALQANAGPDILDMAVAWNIPFASMGKLQAITDLVEADGIDMADYYDSALKTVTIDGGYYGLPYRSETMAMIYNKDLFTAAGLDPEAPPQTWDEALTYAKALTKDDVYGFGMCGYNAGNTTAQIYSLMFSNGAQLLTDDLSAAAFDSPEALAAFTFWTELFTVYGVVPKSVLENDNTTNRNLFAEGKLGMYITGSYDVAPLLEANPDLNMGFCLVPKFGDEGLPSAQLGGWNLGMTDTCKNREAAFKLMSYLTSPEISVQFSSTFSSHKSMVDDPKYADPNLTVFMEAIPHGVPLPGSPYMNRITTIVYNAAQEVLSGVKDAPTALTDAAAETNELLQQ